MRVTFAAVCIVCALVSLAAEPQQPAARPQSSPADAPSPAFTNLINQYRVGNAGAAIVSFSRWPESRVAQEALTPAATTDLRMLAAIAMLHTDAAIANGTFGDLATGTPNNLLIGGWGLESMFEPHSYRAYLIIEKLIARAKAAPDPTLMNLARDWYIVAMSACRYLRHEPCVDELFEKGSHYFGDDSVYRLFDGSLKEPWVRTRTAMKNLSLSQLETFGQESLWLYGQVLKADPSVAEARIRRAHILHLKTPYDPDVVPLLERAIIDARAQQEPDLVYLAALFLGEVHEDRDDVEAAIPAYRIAVSAIRAHTASLALAQALIRTDRSQEGWDVGRRMFGREGPGVEPITDPWELYPYAAYWRIDSHLEGMRAMVRGQ